MSIERNQYLMFIDGKWIGAKSGQCFGVVNPATSETIAEVPKGDREDACRALEAASEAFLDWSNRPPIERANLMRKAVTIVKKREREIATLLTQEEGKPFQEAKDEVSAAIDGIEYFAEKAWSVQGEIIPTDSVTKRSFVIKQPVGVAAAICPWNFPIVLLAWKVSPALISGCTVVAKPASSTPLSSIEFVRCFAEAGFPDGVISLVTGPGNSVGLELVENPIAKKISFTGETGTGKKIMEKASASLKKVSLELGGNSPLIVCEDADMERVIEDATHRAFFNAGQVCNSVNRIYVVRTIAEEFIERFVEKTKKLRVANGLEKPEADVGPMINNQQRNWVKEHIRDAVEKGAKILCGGKEPDGEEFEKGFFFLPTVLGNVDHSMRVMKEETFGPVAPIMAVQNSEEAVKLANDTPYGLVSYLYTKDLKTTVQLSERLEYGSVVVNSTSIGEAPFPYSGWKESGVGVELSDHGLDEYFNLKHIRVDIDY